MKAHLSTCCILALLFTACGEKTTPSAGKAGTTPDGMVLLTPGFPPELIEGTPRPILLPRQTDMGDGHLHSMRARPGATPMPQTAFDGGSGESINPPPVERGRYAMLTDNAWQSPVDAPLSTFSIDVDTASYANVRRMILDRRAIPVDAVRLEEMVNYFDYAYPQPTDDHPFAVHVDNSTCPWSPQRQLVRIAMKGMEIERESRPPANLVFLLDVSGSMNDPRKLPLVTKSLELLIEELNASDTLSIVVYAGAEGLALPPTACDAGGRERILAALNGLRAGGSTNGGAGITLAYRIAREHFKPGGTNRVILATDGDFNVGVTHDGGLVRMVEENAEDQVFLTVLGTGTDNLNDGMLEAITNKGNGVYHYIDSLEEARRIFLQKTMGTLVNIAKDVKIQVEFNPAQVRGYRLLGYSNRMLHKEDFSNDRIDAGDINSGHTVTAFYEVETADGRGMQPVEPLRYGNHPDPTDSDPAASDEWLTVKLRYKQPEGAQSILMNRPFIGVSRDFSEADADFRFGASVAMAAMILRGTEGVEGTGIGEAGRLAAAALGPDPHGQRAGFVTLIRHLAAGGSRW